MLKWSSVKWRKCGTTESLQRSGRVADRRRRKVRMARRKHSLRKKGTSNPVWIIPKDAFNHPKSCRENVLWSDKTKFELLCLDSKIFVYFWCKANTAHQPRNTIPTVSSLYSKFIFSVQMLWSVWFNRSFAVSPWTLTYCTWCSVKSEFVLGGVSFGCGCLCAHVQLRAGPGERCSATVCRLSPGVYVWFWRWWPL